MSNSTRCAACKYLRRRCPKDCIFGPFFPPTNPERFACVHKIFGASNVAKMLKQLPEDRRRETVESLVMEARSRVRDPVYGSVGIITQLRKQIMEAEYELAKTKGLIALYQAQCMHFEAQQPSLIQDYYCANNNLQFDDDYSSLLLNPQQQQQSTTLFEDLTDQSFYNSIN